MTIPSFFSGDCWRFALSKAWRAILLLLSSAVVSKAGLRESTPPIEITKNGATIVLRWHAESGGAPLPFELLRSADLEVWKQETTPPIVSGTAELRFKPQKNSEFFRLSPTQAPGAPSPTLRISQNEFILHWDDIALAAAYSIYVGEDAGVGPRNFSRALTGIETTDVIIDGLEDGKFYYILVVANNEKGSTPAPAPLAKTFGPNGVVTGRLVLNCPDKQGAPFYTGVPGRPVSIKDGRSHNLSTQTNSAGYFEFRDLPVGIYDIVWPGDAAWSGGKELQLNLTDAGRAMGQLTIDPRGDNTVLAGVVNFADGTLAVSKVTAFGIQEAATVSAADAAGRSLGTTTASSDGHYLLTGIPASAYPVTLSATLKKANRTATIQRPAKKAFELTYEVRPPKFNGLIFKDPAGTVTGTIHCRELVSLIPDILNPDQIQGSYRWQISTVDGRVVAESEGTEPRFLINSDLESATLHLHGVFLSDDVVTTQVFSVIRYACKNTRCWSGTALEWNPTLPVTLSTIPGATAAVTASNITGSATANSLGYFEFAKGVNPSEPVVEIKKPGYVPWSWKFHQLPDEAEFPMIKTTTLTVAWPATGSSIALPGGYFLANQGSNWLLKGGGIYEGALSIEIGFYDPLATWQPFPPQPRVDSTMGPIVPRLASAVWVRILGTSGEVLNPNGLPPLLYAPVTPAASGPGGPLAGTPATVPYTRRIDAQGVFSLAGNANNFFGAYYSFPWENATLLCLYTPAPQTQVQLTADRSLNFPFDVLVNNSSFPVTVYNNAGDTSLGALALPSLVNARFRVLNLRQAPGVYGTNFPFLLPHMSYSKQVIVDATRPAANILPATGFVQTLSLAQNVTDLRPVPATVSIAPKLSLPDAFLDVHGSYSSTSATAPYTHIADEYYALINAPPTYSAWKTKNNFPQNILSGTPPAVPAGPWVTAFYYNLGDLGFARRLSMRTFASGLDAQTIVAMAVTNFRSIEDARCDRNPIATVCMEYSPRPLTASPSSSTTTASARSYYQRFVQFTAYDGPSDGLIREASLDGSTPKPLPNLCVTCHGNHRFEPGQSPNLGAIFLPFDPESFTFHRAYGTQSSAFAALNKGVLQTNPNTTVTNLVQGWYGATDPTTASTTFNHSYLPTLTPPSKVSWSAGGPQAAAEYNGVFKNSCRVCHNSRAGYTQVDSWTSWESLRGTAPSYAPCALYMPATQRTWGVFWGARAGEVIAPGSGTDFPSQIFGTWPWGPGCPDNN